MGENSTTIEDSLPVGLPVVPPALLSSNGLGARHRHEFTFFQWPPCLISQRYAGEQRHILALVELHADARERIRIHHAAARKRDEAWRSNLIVALGPAVAVCDQELTVRVQEVCRPELTQLSGQSGYYVDPHGRRWHPSFPERRQTLQQHAKSDFGAGGADRLESVKSGGKALLD